LLVDEDGFTCTSAQRFDAESAGPGKQIQYYSAFNTIVKYIEYTLPETVSRRPGESARNRLKPPAF
jgi:hypothetical protein